MPKQTVIEPEHHDDPQPPQESTQTEPQETQHEQATAEQSAPPKPSHDVRGTLGARLKLKNVNFQKGVATIGFEADRGELSLKQADHYFVNARLQVTIRVDEDQAELPGVGIDAVNSVVDVKRFGTDVEKITGSMAFSIDEVEPSALLAIRGKHVRLLAARIGSADEEAEGHASEVDDHDDHDEDGDTPDLFDGEGVDAEHTPQGADAWKAVKIDALGKYGVTAKQLEILREHGVTTLGKYGELGVKHGTFWHRDIKGIGPEVAGKIGDAFNAFILQNPHLTQDAPEPQGEPVTLLDWQQGKGSHVAFAYSQLKAEGEDAPYGYWIDQAGDVFVLSGEREVIAEDSEHATLDAAKAAAERIEQAHRAAAEGVDLSIAPAETPDHAA